MYHGYAKIQMGPPIGLLAGGVSLSKAVHDAHRILDTELESMGVNPEQAIVTGDSRGAMTGLGMSVPQYAGNRRIVYADVKAACIPEPLELSDWPGVIAQLKGEGSSLVKIGLEYARRGQIAQYIASLPPRHVSHVPNALRIFPGLIGGEAGRLFDASDPNTAVHLTEFASDKWGQVDVWRDKFADRDNAVVVEKYGNHVDGIAATRTRRDTSARLRAISEIRGFDGSFDTIDFARDVFTVNRKTYEETKKAVRLLRVA